MASVRHWKMPWIVKQLFDIVTVHCGHCQVWLYTHYKTWNTFKDMRSDSISFSGHVEYSLSKGWIWVCYVIGLKNIQIWPSTQFQILCMFKYLHSGEQIHVLDSPDTCGRKANPQRKIFRLKNISRYMWKGAIVIIVVISWQSALLYLVNLVWY